jgi:formamidopyrimidine-DNA glycosylase
MFELPEIVTLASQMNASLSGKVISQGNLGNSPHKFVWYNRTREEFAALVEGKQVGQAAGHGRWLMLDLEPGYRLVLGEFGGKALFHAAGTPLPTKTHLVLFFKDGSAFSVLTAMWGAMELYEKGRELERQYIKDMRLPPLDPGFSRDYFTALVAKLLKGEKRSVKSLLTQEQLIPGLGNSIAQDILFNARLQPRHPLSELSEEQLRALYDSIMGTTRQVIAAGGRNDETDLLGKPGGYMRIMNSQAAGKPCPRCGATVEKFQYLGGACYNCPGCQV